MEQVLHLILIQLLIVSACYRAKPKFAVHPETGAVAATDGNINPSDPSVAAVAYTNSFAGAATTILYDIDVASNKLYKQNPPNNGTLELVGSLGLRQLAKVASILLLIIQLH